MYKVLVDSSVWIEYLKQGKPSVLDQLITEDLVCTNEIILTELIPFLMKQDESETAEELMSFEKIPIEPDWDIIRDYQLTNLKKGINKVGIPDLMIIQQVIQNKLTLFSFDKHFSLMASYLTFDAFGT